MIRNLTSDMPGEAHSEPRLEIQYVLGLTFTNVSRHCENPLTWERLHVRKSALDQGSQSTHAGSMQGCCLSVDTDNVPVEDLLLSTY